MDSVRRENVHARPCGKETIALRIFALTTAVSMASVWKVCANAGQGGRGWIVTTTPVPRWWMERHAVAMGAVLRCPLVEL